MFFTTSSGRIELNITKAQARIGYHTGDCYDDCGYLRTVPAIRRQLARIDPAVLRAELDEWGAWDKTELADHDANLTRILWLACGDIVESLA